MSDVGFAAAVPSRVLRDGTGIFAAYNLQIDAQDPPGNLKEK
jgi:hypothetical protein